MTPRELVDTLRGPLRNFSYRLPAADMIEQLIGQLDDANGKILKAKIRAAQLEHGLKKAGGRKAVRKALR